MAEVSIKVSVAGRIYPLKVEKVQEPIIKKAAQLINDKVKLNEDVYFSRDKQDSLAMSALQLVVESLNKQYKQSQLESEQLQEVDGLLSEYLDSLKA